MDVAKKQKTPFEHLLETGLTYWVRSQCKSIDSLKINIKGLSLGFPNNTVSDINLIAKEVNFKDIHFEQLNINAEFIKFKINLMNKSGGILSIEDDFKIEDFSDTETPALDLPKRETRKKETKVSFNFHSILRRKNIL